MLNCRLNLLSLIGVTRYLTFNVGPFLSRDGSYLIQYILIDNMRFILRCIGDCGNTNRWRYLTNLISRIPYGFTWHLGRLYLNCRPLCTPFFIWRSICWMVRNRYVCVLDLVHIVVYGSLICGTFQRAILLGVMSLIEDSTMPLV